jgi:glycosyltransferase involved in cell wall biosynthesis
MSGPPAAGGLWIIVPAYNEGCRLGRLLEGLCRTRAQVVVVDDGSDDETSTVALRYPVWVVRHLFNRGQGAALQTGIEFALRHGADLLVTFDGDGQHDVEDIAALVRPIREGTADVVLGSRFRGRAVGLPWGRWLVLKLGVLFTRFFSGLSVSDTHNGLRALSRSAAEQLRITQDRMAHASEILGEVRRHGLRYVEIPVTVAYSSETLSKGQTSWNALKIAAQLFLGRFIP